MSTLIKICGLKDEAALRAVAEAKANFAGFIFYPHSPRHISFEEAASLKAAHLPVSIQSVSVLVNPDDALLGYSVSLLSPDYIQLHGNESPARIVEIRKRFPHLKIIKAISVRSGDDVAKASAYADVVDMLMFDAKAPEGMLPGGNGLSFDWVLLKDREFQKPWFLSGGLHPDNVAKAIHATGAKMVDVSSGVERTPGVKDPALIERFVKAVRHEK